MKVCFFLGGFYQNGGIGRVTSILINKLSENEHIEISALCYFDAHKPNLYPLSSRIRQSFLLPQYKSMSKFLLTGGVRKLRKFLIDNSIDIVVACGALFYPLAVRACRTIRTKCICWEHSDPEGNNDHKGQRFARKYGISHSDMNVVLTKRALKVYCDKYGAKNTAQIYNPIDTAVLEKAKPYDASAKQIISVGRLEYQKNFETAVEVARKVLTAHPDWTWDIFGKGPEQEKLQQLIDEAGLSAQMTLRGQVSDLYDRYSHYSFLVMTSRYEGFPMVLLEGCGNALPLVSFDIPTGPDEIIVDGENGYLLKAFDVDGMAQKIADLLDDAELRLRMSAFNTEYCKCFSERKVIGEWEQLLWNMLTTRN